MLAPFFFRSTRREKSVNFKLIGAMLDVLETRSPREAARYRELLVAEHGTAVGARDLLHPAYRVLSLADQYTDQERYGYYRASARVSRFALVCTAREDLQIRMIVRTPGARDDDRVQVRLNGHVVQRAPASGRWRRVQFGVSAALVVDGINDLEVEWPASCWSYAHRTAGMRRALADGQKSDGGPVLGELHSLVVATALETANVARPGEPSGSVPANSSIAEVSGT